MKNQHPWQVLTTQRAEGFLVTAYMVSKARLATGRDPMTAEAFAAALVAEFGQRVRHALSVPEDGVQS